MKILIEIYWNCFKTAALVLRRDEEEDGGHEEVWNDCKQDRFNDNKITLVWAIWWNSFCVAFKVQHYKLRTGAFANHKTWLTWENFSSKNLISTILLVLYSLSVFHIIVRFIVSIFPWKLQSFGNKRPNYDYQSCHQKNLSRCDLLNYFIALIVLNSSKSCRDEKSFAIDF